jgi:hypothetical protein
MKCEMKQFSSQIRAVLCISAAAILWTGFALAAEDPAVAAARKRQEAIKSFDIEFKRTEVIPKGWFTKEPKGALPGPRPEKDVTLESVNRIVGDLEKMRIESNHPREGILQFVNSNFVLVCDGSSETLLFPKGVTPNSGAFAAIDSQKTDRSAINMAPIDPLLLFFRGLDRDLHSIPIFELQATGRNLSIDGDTCEEYEHRRQNSLTSFWLDPAKGYLVRKMIFRTRNGQISSQWNINYVKDDRFGWLPDSWILTNYRDGEVRLKTNVKLTAVHLNVPQSAELFVLQFPEGTLVMDERSRKQFRANADGTLSEVSLADQKPKDPPPQRPQSWFARNRWLNFSIAMALLIVLFIVRFRRRPAKRMKALPFD